MISLLGMVTVQQNTAQGRRTRLMRMKEVEKETRVSLVLRDRFFDRR
jgi:hypothetical protein